METINIQFSCENKLSDGRSVVQATEELGWMVAPQVEHRARWITVGAWQVPQEVAAPFLRKKVNVDEQHSLYKHPFVCGLIIDLDIDHATPEAKECLWKQVVNFEKTFPGKLNVDFSIHFSGAKGFHILIPWWKLTGAPNIIQSATTEAEVDAMLKQRQLLADKVCQTYGITAIYDNSPNPAKRVWCDHSMYQKERLCRIAYTQHDKLTENYCVALTKSRHFSETYPKTFEDIVKLSKEPIQPRYAEINGLVGVPDTKEPHAETIRVLGALLEQPKMEAASATTAKATRKKEPERVTGFKCDVINYMLSPDVVPFLRKAWAHGQGRRFVEWYQPITMMASTEPAPDVALEHFIDRLKEIFGAEADEWAKVNIPEGRKGNCIAMLKIVDGMVAGTNVKPCKCCTTCPLRDEIMTPDNEEFNIDDLPQISRQYLTRLVAKFIEDNNAITLKKNVLIYTAGHYKIVDDEVVLSWFVSKLKSHYNTKMRADIMTKLVAMSSISETSDRMKTDGWICLKNCNYNWITKTVAPHSPELIFLSQVDVNWNPEAKSELATKFFQGYWRNQAEWDEWGEAIMASIGYSMTTDLSWQSMFVCVGTSLDDDAAGRGKSTLIKTAGAMMGTDAFQSFDNTDQLRDKFATERIAKARIVYFDDWSKKDSVEDGIKQYVDSNVSVPLERKGKNAFIVKAYPHMWINSNYGEVKGNSTEGYYRRIVKFPFKNPIVGTEWEIPNVTGLIAKDEEAKSFFFHTAMTAYHKVSETCKGKLREMYPLLEAAVQEEKTDGNVYYDCFREHLKIVPGQHTSTTELTLKVGALLKMKYKFNHVPGPKTVLDMLRKMAKQTIPKSKDMRQCRIDNAIVRALPNLKIIGIEEERREHTPTGRYLLTAPTADDHDRPSIVTHTEEQAAAYYAMQNGENLNPFKSFSRFMQVYRNITAVPAFEAEVARNASYAMGSPVHTIGELFFHGISNNPEVDGRLMYAVNSALNTQPEIKAAIEAKNAEMVANHCEIVPLRDQQAEAFNQAFGIMNDTTYDPGSLDSIQIQ